MTSGEISEEPPGPVSSFAHEAAYDLGTNQQLATSRRAVVLHSILIPACDVFALAAAVLLTAAGWWGALYAIAVLVLVGVTGRRRPRLCLRVADDVPNLTAAAGLSALPLLALMEPARNVIELALLSAVLLWTLRFGCYAGLRVAHRHELLTQPTLIVGTDRLSVELGKAILEHPDLGLRPVGLVRTGNPTAETTLPVLGDTSEVGELVERYGVRRVIVGLPVADDDRLVSALRSSARFPADVYMVPRMYPLRSAVPPGCLDEIWGIPLVQLGRSGLSWSGCAVKRSFDLVAASAMLAGLGPALLVIMLVVRLRCGKPVFFRQSRISRAGRTIEIAKIRTLTSTEPDSEWAPVEHVNGLCAWLRGTHLDELPQLWSVIRGDMSLVGPRPERPYFAEVFGAAIPGYRDRLRARAGMTGWAQVHGLTGDTSIAERVRFDNYYIDHWSFWLDVVILAKTGADLLTSIPRRHAPGRPPVA